MAVPYSKTLNHGRFETWTKKPDREFHHVHQVHGPEIVSLETLPTHADGMVSSWEDLTLPLAIKTADCMPIVIEGETGVIALHAGWKGLAAGILDRPELHLIHPVRVLIGPAIHGCCFEVSEDFRMNFPKSPHFRTTNGQLHFDLIAEARDRLLATYPDLRIEAAPECTKCNPNFHSYRRGKENPERNWNLYIKGS